MDKIHNFNSEKTFIEAVTTSITSRILKKQSEGGIFRLALSGGNTPKPIYEALSKSSSIDWTKVEIYQVDERYVPKNDEFSNQKMLNETLIQKLRQRPAKVVLFNPEIPIKDSIQEYEEQLEKTNDTYFDLVLLGIGTDGHTASLFPHDKLLKENKRWVGISNKGNPVTKRMTMTYPAICSSKEIFFIVKGKDKEKTLQKIIKAKTSSAGFPSSRIIHMNNVQVFSM